MKNRLGKTIVLMLVFVGLCAMFSNVNAADPSVISVETNPESPEPESTVTVTANITGDEISSVNLTVSECTDEGDNVACFAFQTVKMSLNSDGFYEANFTLKDAEGRSNHIKYELTVISNDTSFDFTDSSFRADLSEAPGDNNTTPTKEEDKGIPGFEIVFVLMALIIGLFLFKQKRLR